MNQWYMNFGGLSTTPLKLKTSKLLEMIINTLPDGLVAAKSRKNWFKYFKSCLEVPRVWITTLIPWIEYGEWTELIE